jgi:preprotein translocase subunit YajC
VQHHRRSWGEAIDLIVYVLFLVAVLGFAFYRAQQAQSLS